MLIVSRRHLLKSQKVRLLQEVLPVLNLTETGVNDFLGEDLLPSTDMAHDKIGTLSLDAMEVD
jgi:hypothetical protein